MFGIDADRNDREIIILSSILPNEINMGYSCYPFNNFPLTHANDEPVYNLKHFASIVDNNEKPYLKLSFSNLFDQSTNVLILDSLKVKKNSKQILKENLIAFDRSDNLR